MANLLESISQALSRFSLNPETATGRVRAETSRIGGKSLSAVRDIAEKTIAGSVPAQTIARTQTGTPFLQALGEAWSRNFNPPEEQVQIGAERAEQIRQGKSGAITPTQVAKGGELVLGTLGPSGAIGGAGKVTTKLAQEVAETPVQKIINALKEAKPVRGQQETLYTLERGKRFGEAERVAGATKGETGFAQELSQLKGELPKAEFTPLKLEQKDVDGLFDAVKNSQDLTYLDTIAARRGLSKLLGEYGGAVPTEGEIELLSKVFPREFTEELLTKRPIWDKVKEGVSQVINIPRTLMSSFDISFGGRQGIYLAPSFRKEFFKAFKEQFSAIKSEQAYNAVIQNIKRSPNFTLAKESGLSFTDVGATIGTREERFMSSWAEKIPLVGKGVAASNRAYTAFANKLRMETFDSMVSDAMRLGFNPAKDRDLTKQMVRFINSATGRGPLGGKIGQGAAPLLNAIFFSPRLTTGRLDILFSPLTYATANPLVRRQALKSFAAFTGYIATILTLAKAAGAEVGLEPTSSDFLKIRIGDTRIDVSGGFQQYLRVMAQLFKGEVKSSSTGKTTKVGEGYKPLTRFDILVRFFENKESPIASLITSLLKGKDFAGRPLDVKTELANRFIPLVIQDAIELGKEDPGLIPLAGLAALGFGVQTYSAAPGGGGNLGLPSLKMGDMGLPSLKMK